MTIELSDQEREVLFRLLDNEIADTGPEIHHARNIQYHTGLKEYKHLLQALRNRLASAPALEPRERAQS